MTKSNELRWSELFMALWIGILVLAASSCRGGVTEAQLDWVAWVESRGNPNARGALDDLGLFQLRAVAVEEVNRVYGWKLTHASMTNPAIARAAARAVLHIHEARLSKALGRRPTFTELYTSYRYGVTGFFRMVPGLPQTSRECSRPSSPMLARKAANGRRVGPAARVADKPRNRALSFKLSYLITHNHNGN